MLLELQGRLLNDIFLHLQEAGTTPAFLIEHDESQTEALRAYLKRHILRSKVKLAKQADADRAVFAAWRTEEESGEESLQSAEAWLLERKAAKDDRAPGMGWRWTGLKEGDARGFFLESLRRPTAKRSASLQPRRSSLRTRRRHIIIFTGSSMPSPKARKIGHSSLSRGTLI